MDRLLDLGVGIALRARPRVAPKRRCRGAQHGPDQVGPRQTRGAGAEGSGHPDGEADGLEAARVDPSALGDDLGVVVRQSQGLADPSLRSVARPTRLPQVILRVLHGKLLFPGGSVMGGSAPVGRGGSSPALTRRGNGPSGLSSQILSPATVPARPRCRRGSRGRGWVGARTAGPWGAPRPGPDTGRTGRGGSVAASRLEAATWAARRVSDSMGQ